MKKIILNRLQDAEIRAKQLPPVHIQRIIKNMTTDDLRELADENITEERFKAIWKRAENEYKSKLIKKA